MSAWPILLRLCLCIALVFNGASAAMASVRMAHMQAQAVQAVFPANQPAPLASDADSAMPCHGHGAQVAQQEGVHQSAVTADPGSPLPKYPSPDCCDSDTCRCACMQHGLAAIPMVPFSTVTLAHVDGVRPMTIGHATPALPHLIRPPIG